MSLPTEMVCPVCDGTGRQTYDDVDCCGNYLDTGECCAAIYGTDRLIPIQIDDVCYMCDGTGEVDDNV
jgi:DnaJ-class molecular chaperone